MRVNYAIEAANKIIDRLALEIDQAARAMMIPTLLSNLLQFQNGRDVELILPAPQISEEKTETTENG